MKRLILTAIFAALLASVGSAQTTKTADKYIIDGKEVTHFDGSQLKGKIILNYNLDSTLTGVVHQIKTSDGLKNDINKAQYWNFYVQKKPGKQFKGKFQIRNPYAGTPIYVVDGVVKKDGLVGISPDHIVSVTVHKPGSKVALDYGNDGKNTVVVVTTGEKAVPVYVVAGKMMSEEEAKKLSSDRIKNIVVAKKGSKEAVKLGGEKQGNQHDYISIELK